MNPAADAVLGAGSWSAIQYCAGPARRSIYLLARFFHARLSAACGDLPRTERVPPEPRSRSARNQAACRSGQHWLHHVRQLQRLHAAATKNASGTLLSPLGNASRIPSTHSGLHTKPI